MKTTLALVATLLLLGGCGGLVVFDRDGSGGDGGGPSATTGTTNSGPSSNVSSSNVSSSTGGNGTLVPTIVAVKLGADCMPKIGPDPMFGSVLVDYTNTSQQPGSLVISYAQVIISSPMEGWVFPIELSPDSSGSVAAGSSVEVEHLKTASPVEGSLICSFCGLNASLAVTWTGPGGQSVSATAPFDLFCAF